MIYDMIEVIISTIKIIGILQNINIDKQTNKNSETQTTVQWLPEGKEVLENSKGAQIYGKNNNNKIKDYFV